MLGETGSGVNPRATFHNKFQREIEEHDQDLGRRYDEDLNTTLIFVSATAELFNGRAIDSNPFRGVAYRPVYSQQ
jgi:hypothetical protein